MPLKDKQLSDAKEVIAYYTLAAATTGAIPVPAASVAIIAENACMIAHIASKLGTNIDIKTVTSSFGLMGAANVIGRNLFIEGAKLLSWGTASIWAVAGVSALGATTAGVQTYVIGMLAIEIGKNNGDKLSSEKARSTIGLAKEGYGKFREEWKDKNPNKPSSSEHAMNPSTV